MTPYNDPDCIIDYLAEKGWPSIRWTQERAASYAPIYDRTGKFQHIRFPANSVGGFLEASSHEMAHMLDLMISGKPERLLVVDYGMGFDIGEKYKYNYKKIVECESNVFAIQALLQRVAGFEWNDIMSCMVSCVNSSVDLPFFAEAEDRGFTLASAYTIVARAKRFKRDSIKKAWASVVDYLSNSVAKTK